MLRAVLLVAALAAVALADTKNDARIRVDQTTFRISEGFKQIVTFTLTQPYVGRARRHAAAAFCRTAVQRKTNTATCHYPLPVWVLASALARLGPLLCLFVIPPRAGLCAPRPGPAA
jgi:hypothetical protein